MIMMPYDLPWSSLQLTSQADFWHPTGGIEPSSHGFEPDGTCGRARCPEHHEGGMVRARGNVSLALG